MQHIKNNEFNYSVVWVGFNTEIFLLNFTATKNFRLTDDHLWSQIGPWPYCDCLILETDKVQNTVFQPGFRPIWETREEQWEGITDIEWLGRSFDLASETELKKPLFQIKQYFIAFRFLFSEHKILLQIKRNNQNGSNRIMQHYYIYIGPEGSWNLNNPSFIQNNETK